MTAQHGAATDTRDEARAAPAWRQLAVFGGGADRLDDVLTKAVLPAVHDALRSGSVESWSFVRGADRRGAYLRLDVAGDASVLAAALERSVPDAARAASSAETLLPRPASQRAGRRLAGVVVGEGGDPASLLDRLSSEAAAAALPHLGDARERTAFALALLRALGRDAAFWDEAARRWVGDDARAEHLIAHLGRLAERLGPRLDRAASSLGEEPRAAIDSWADAVRSDESADPQREAHLICNRLGVTPIEEALLALHLASGQETALEVRGVTKDDVLEDVSFEVAEGESLAVLGPEGAGKSSLLGILAGLRVASGGAVRVLGRDPRRDHGELAGAIGIPLPDDELPEDSTVRECLEIEAKARGGGDVDGLMQTSGLGTSASVPVADLDPGARRRLSFATALLGDPRVVLLDAPAWELSPVERDEVWRLVRLLGESGSTVVIATTSLEEARELADRAALLVAGEIAFLGGVEELADELFPERTVRFKIVDEPDRAALEELPEVIGVRFEQEADHWSIEARTRQPDELLRLLGADPEFPEIVEVGSQDLYSTFAQPQRRDD